MFIFCTRIETMKSLEKRDLAALSKGPGTV